LLQVWNRESAVHHYHHYNQSYQSNLTPTVRIKFATTTAHNPRGHNTIA